jgi:membrane fusion protein, multidrug efflux system
VFATSLGGKQKNAGSVAEGRLKEMNVGRGGRILLYCAVVIAVGGTGAWYLHQGPEPVPAARSSAPPTVPVTVATAIKRDLPIYLTGLGSVQASFTIGIRSQADGKLERVLFTEGQRVKRGDVLAKVDPRLYQASGLTTHQNAAEGIAQIVGAISSRPRSMRRSRRGRPTTP